MVPSPYVPESLLPSQPGSASPWSAARVPDNSPPLGASPSSRFGPGSFPHAASPQPVQRSLFIYSRHQRGLHTRDAASSDSIDVPPSTAGTPRPFRYRCQSDTVALDSRTQSELSDSETASSKAARFRASDACATLRRTPVAFSSPASCGADPSGRRRLPARPHLPSLASVSFHEHSEPFPSPSCSSGELDLTQVFPEDTLSPLSVSETSLAPQPQARPSTAAASATFSPATLSQILEAAASFQAPSQPPATPRATGLSKVRLPSGQISTTMNGATPPLGVPAPGVCGGPEGPLIHHGIAGSGIVVAPPTPRGGPSPMAPTQGGHLVSPPSRTGPPLETSSTRDRQWVAVTAYRPVDVVTKTVEVPITRTVDVLVPRPVIQEKIVEVPKFVPHYVEKILEVPEIEWVDRVIEVPEYFYKTKYVPKVEIRENIIERPLYQDKWVEKIVEVPRVEEIVRYRDIVEAEEVIKYIPKGHSEEEWRGAPIFSVPPEHAPPLPPKWVSPGLTPGCIPGCATPGYLVTPDGPVKGRTKLVEQGSPSAFPPPPMNARCPAVPFWTVDSGRAGKG